MNSLITHLTPFRVKHVLLKLQKYYVISLDFFNWVQTNKPNSHTLETHLMILHILTKNKKFKFAESILKGILVSGSIDLPAKLFDAVLYSYRMCDSSSRVFDSLFKTYAHMKKFRNATDVFCQMKDYGFLPTFESCNKYISSLLGLNKVDIALGFYKKMRRCMISPNVYTLNMVIGAFWYCNKGLLSSAMKLKNSMGKDGLQPNVITFNTLIYGFCKEGKLHEANMMLSGMKSMNVTPNIVTCRLRSTNGVKTFERGDLSNALISHVSLKSMEEPSNLSVVSNGDDDKELEFRSYVDNAWYSVRVAFDGRAGKLIVRYCNFLNDNDSVYEAGNFFTFEELDDFASRFCPVSVQLQDSECRDVIIDELLICASHAFTYNDVLFYDAVVE
ncbi:hypothetical protein Q3G72_028238 [Acer saccharum]|nr:hypothetical protein Q3G72_028238 [Acer saccharum]